MLCGCSVRMRTSIRRRNRAGRYLDRSAEYDKCHAWVSGRKDVATQAVSPPSGHPAARPKRCDHAAVRLAAQLRSGLLGLGREALGDVVVQFALLFEEPHA